MSKTLKQLNAQITAIQTKGKKLRAECHATLIDVVEHYIEHGDTTLIPKLVDAVKNALGSSLSAAMNQWIATSVTSLKWNDDEKRFEHIKKVTPEIRDLKDVPMKTKAADGTNQKYTGNARGLPFFELERETNQEPFNIEKAIAQLVKRAQSAYEKNIKEHAHNEVNSAQIELLKQVAESIKEVKPEPDAIDEGKEPKARGRKSKAEAKTETPALVEG